MTRAACGILVLFVLATACSPRLLVADRTIHGTTPGTTIAVMISEKNPVYDQVLAGFQGAFRGSMTVYTNINEENASPRSLKATVQQTHPDLIFAIGDAAASLLHDAHLTTPVLFTLVVDADAFAGAANFCGVSMTIAPVAAFTRFRSIAPTMARVLAFYESPMIGAMLQDARHDLEALNINLTPIGVGGLSEVRRALEERTDQYDAIWMTADPVMINQETFDFLRGTTLTQKKILLSTVSEKLTEAGALMSVSSDFHGTGALAALLAFKILEQHVAPQALGVRLPVGAKVSVNVKTALDIGLPIEPQGMMMVSDIYH